jgi:trehalose 6-phosphate phosphatase
MKQFRDDTIVMADTGLNRVPAINPEHDAILLDVDGTLVDIAQSPESVHVPLELCRSLASLVDLTGGALALVSGRTMSSIDALFAPLRTAAIGCHGAQMRIDANAAIEVRVPPLSREIRAAFADIAVLEPRIRVEDKIFSVAFHYRNTRDLEETLGALLHARIAPFEREYAVMRGKAVFEIKPRFCTKGEAVRDLMRRTPFAGRRPVFFGDDTTDEYAFAALGEFGGVGVSVGRSMADAECYLASPGDVRQLLAVLANDGEEEKNDRAAGS